METPSGQRFIVGFCVLGYETPTLLHRSGCIPAISLSRVLGPTRPQPVVDELKNS